MIDHKYITGELLMLAFALGWWFRRIPAAAPAVIPSPGCPWAGRLHLSPFGFGS